MPMALFMPCPYVHISSLRRNYASGSFAYLKRRFEVHTIVEIMYNTLSQLQEASITYMYKRISICDVREVV
jgi:hypothetical protein